MMFVTRLAFGLDGPVEGSAAWRGDTLHLTSGSDEERGGWFAATFPMPPESDSKPRGLQASFMLMMAPSAGESHVEFVLGEPPLLLAEKASDDTGLVIRFASPGKGKDQAIGRIEVRYAGRFVATSTPRRLRNETPAYVDIEITPAGELTVIHRNDTDPVLSILRRRLTNWQIAPEWRPGMRGASGSPGTSQWVSAIKTYQGPSECGNGLVEIGEDCERRSERACWEAWCSRECTLDLPIRGKPTGVPAPDDDACSASLRPDSPDLAITGLCRLHARSVHLVPSDEDLHLTVRDDSGRTLIEDILPGLPWDVQRRGGWRRASSRKEGILHATVLLRCQSGREAQT